MDKEAIGQRIKQIRISKGKTMKEFGQLFDPAASDSIVSRWERGISVPNNERLKEIAEIGEIDLEELLHGTKNDKLLQTLIETENEVKKSYSLFEEERFQRFFHNISEFRQSVLNEVNSLGMTGDTKISAYYKLQLLHEMPFLEKYEDLIVQVYMLSAIHLEIGEYFTLKDNILLPVSSEVEEFADPNYMKALFDTIKCFEDTNLKNYQLVHMPVLLNNISYYENEEGYTLIDSKNKYIDFLRKRIEFFKDKTKNPEIEKLESQLYWSSYRTDEKILEALLSE